MRKINNQKFVPVINWYTFQFEIINVAILYRYIKAVYKAILQPSPDYGDSLVIIIKNKTKTIKNTSSGKKVSIKKTGKKYIIKNYPNINENYRRYELTKEYITDNMDINGFTWLGDWFNVKSTRYFGFPV